MTITDPPIHYPTLTPVPIAALETVLGVVEHRDDLSVEEAAAAAELRIILAGALTIQHQARTSHPSLDIDVAALDAANVAALPVAHHHGGHVTEAVAARSLELRVGNLRTRALAELVGEGSRGLTDLELEDRLSVRRPTGGNRRGELVKLGLVTASVENGRTRTRIIAGRRRPATVWVATERGVDALLALGYIVEDRSAVRPGQRVVIEPIG